MIFSRFNNKKALQASVLLTGLLLFSTTCFGAKYLSITKDDVNVRSGPSTSNPVYMEVFKDYPFKVIDSKGDWYKVTDYEKDTGWIHESLTRENNTVIVNVKKSVRLRSEPSATADIIGHVDRGVVLTRLDQKNDWTKVRHSGGTTGWIFNKMLWP